MKRSEGKSPELDTLCRTILSKDRFKRLSEVKRKSIIEYKARSREFRRRFVKS